MSKQQEPEESSFLHRIMTVAGTVLCILLVPILVMNCILIAKSYLNPDEVPSFGGRVPMIVLTDSMYPEFESGDMIICRTKDAGDIAVGDVICFFDPAGNGTSTVSHRVTEVTTDENGDIAWRTKGDANNAEDAFLVPEENLIGVYQMKIAGAGNIAMFMQTTKGLIVCVVLPILLLVGYDIIRRMIYEKKNKADTEALLKELEELRKEKQEQQEHSEKRGDAKT